MCFNAAVEAPYTLLYDCQYLYTCFLDYLLEMEMKNVFIFFYSAHPLILAGEDVEAVKPGSFRRTPSQQISKDSLYVLDRGLC